MQYQLNTFVRIFVKRLHVQSTDSKTFHGPASYDMLSMSLFLCHQKLSPGKVTLSLCLSLLCSTIPFLICVSHVQEDPGSCTPSFENTDIKRAKLRKEMATATLHPPFTLSEPSVLLAGVCGCVYICSDVCVCSLDQPFTHTCTHAMSHVHTHAKNSENTIKFFAIMFCLTHTHSHTQTRHTHTHFNARMRAH